MKSQSMVYVGLILLISVHLSNGYVFFNGRPINGSIGLPKTSVKWDKDDFPEAQWFDQKLNHFNITNDKTWRQRYFVNGSFYEKGGPVFLQIGGEGTANPIWVVEGQCVKYARKFNAMVVLLEHRYYGASHPTPDMSVDNLKYLSSEQALADLAFFSKFIKKDLPKDTKLISFGGSYPGSLAAWFRLKYPSIVHASISSSAPMVAVADFNEYLGVVRDSLATTGTGCNSAIKDATKALEMYLQHPIGRVEIKKMFRLCDDLDATNQDDVYNFYSNLAGNVEGVVQYNKDNRAFEGAVGTNITIDTVCSLMTNTKLGNPLKRYAAVNNLTLSTYGTKCLDFKYSNFINSLRNTSWNSSSSEGGRQWTYQTCTEFGFYQSSSLKDQPFGNHFPVEFFIKQCKDIFGDKFDENLLNKAISRTNTIYGGLDIQVSRVMFINGDIDPWHALGITKSTSKDMPIVLIKGTAHCANMYPDSPDDLPQLRMVRTVISNQINEWLKE